MSASPHLAPEKSPTALAPCPETCVKLNGLMAGGAAAMVSEWKRWEGQVVDGQFPLKKFLGGSDHSAVFLTERRGKDPQKAAIKIIPADGENAGGQLFRWRLAAKLLHPRLISLFESGRSTIAKVPVVYVVMEYAEEDLAQILPQRPLAPAEARQTMQPVLEALAYIHSKGFAHGSLRPSNIMAVAEKVKIASDTLRATGESERNPGIVPDKTAYDAPESDGRTISPAADVWSLGMTLVEILTQRLPEWNRTQSQEPGVPHSIASSFRDVAQNSLRLDPLQRWKLPQITLRLTSASPEPNIGAVVAESEKKSNTKWLYILAIAAAVLVIAVLAGTKLRTPAGEPAQQVAAQTPQEPAAEVASKPLPGKPAAEQPSEPEPATAAPHEPTPSEPEAASHTTANNSANPDASSAVVHRAMPDVSRRALHTIHGHVRVAVKLNVDPSGNVVRANLSSPGPSKYFARKSLEAAKNWKFAPAQMNGEPVPSEWVVHFAFARAGTEVNPVRTAP